MGRYAGFLLSLILPICFDVAHARALDEAELATLRAGKQGPAQQDAARILARKLGAEQNLEAVPVLLQLRDEIAMNWYVNDYLHGVPPKVAQSTLDAMALAAVKDPSFNADDSSSSTRSEFLRLLGPYQSRELFQLFYDGAKRALIDLRAGRTPKGYFWVNTNMLVPDLPDIEEADAALLPLIDRAWSASSLAALIQKRHYLKGFDRLRDLYLRIPDYYDNRIMEAVASFRIKAGNDALVKRARWLATRPQSRAIDDEISALVAALGPAREPPELRGDYEPLVRELLASDLSPQLKESLQKASVQQIELARRYREFSPENLSYWIAAGDADMVRQNLAHRVDVNARVPNIRSILAQAIETSRLDLVQPLVQAGADLNEHNGSRPNIPYDPMIFLAACPGHKPLPGKVDDSGAIVSLLLVHGALVTEHSSTGLTPLQAASRCANRATVQALLSGGADADATKAPMLMWDGRPSTGDVWAGATALHFAVEARDLETVATLLDHKANVNAQMTDGKTALLMAVGNGDRPIVDLLLERHADVNLGSVDGIGALQMAHIRHAEDLENILKARGALPSPAPVTVAFTREPGLEHASPVSLARIDRFFLQVFFEARHQAPFLGSRFIFDEDRKVRSNAAQVCRERRDFRLMFALDNTPAINGTVAWQEYARYSIMLCEHGPFAPNQFRTTLDQALASTRSGMPAVSELGDMAGFPLQLGKRSGRATVLFEIGHGVILVPLAIVPSSDARRTLLVVVDDAHIGQTGHEVKRTLADLAALLDAVDKESAVHKESAGRQGR
jgi:ankyrin repeat protein